MKLCALTHHVIDSLRQFMRDDPVGDPLAGSPSAPILMALKTAADLRVTPDGMHGGLGEGPCRGLHLG